MSSSTEPTQDDGNEKVGFTFCQRDIHRCYELLICIHIILSFILLRMVEMVKES